MRGTIGALVALSFGLAACAIAPNMTWNMPGVSMEQWDTDLEACGGFNTNNGPTRVVTDNSLQAQNAATAAVSASGVGAGGAVASGFAAGFAAGIIRAEQRKASLAERDECLRSRGYTHLMLTPAQGKAALKLSLEDRKAMAYRLVTAVDVMAVSPEK